MTHQDTLRATQEGFERLISQRKQRRDKRRKHLMDLRATTTHLSQQYTGGVTAPSPAREPDYAKPIGTKPPQRAVPTEADVPTDEVQEQDVRGQQKEAPIGGTERKETKRKPSTRKTKQGGGK